MEKEMFDELIAACHEALEHERGNITLKSNTITLSDEEAERHQLFHQNFSRLSDAGKQKVIQYVDELFLEEAI